MAPPKAKHEEETAKDYTRPVSSPIARPKHDSPDNPRIYGKPAVSPPRDVISPLQEADKDTRPDTPSPYTGRT